MPTHFEREREREREGEVIIIKLKLKYCPLNDFDWVQFRSNMKILIQNTLYNKFLLCILRFFHFSNLKTQSNLVTKHK